MSFPRGNLPLGCSRLAGQSLEYDWRSHSYSRRAYYCNYPDLNPEPENPQPPRAPMPENPPQQPPWGWLAYVKGESHYRAVNEMNVNFRRNEGYGERGRRPYDRVGSGNARGPYPYSNTGYQNVNRNLGPRSFERPLRAPPPDDHRHWQYALTQPPSQNERFIILSYNILADYLTRDHGQQLYMHIPNYILDWDWRKRRILLELGLWSPDIMCLQEVDKFQDLLQELKQRGYGGVYKERTGIAKDGCAIFWRTSRFELMHEEYIEYSKLNLRDNVAQICVLQSKFMGNAQAGASHVENSGQKPGAVNRVVVCNIHVLFNPKRGEIKLGQVRVLLERAHAVSKAWDDAPLVITGDFNCTPKSPLYDFLSKYKLDISGLARNQISGQPGNQPNFRHGPPNRDVPDLARLAGTILRSAMGNEVVHKDKNITNYPTSSESTSGEPENTPKDLTVTSIGFKSVSTEKGSVSAGSTKENFPLGPECVLKSITGSTMDVKANYGKDVKESYAMEQGQRVSFTDVRQTSQYLSAQETVKVDAAETEEGSVLSSLEVRETQDKRYPNEFERVHVRPDGNSLEDCCMTLPSVGNHPGSVEQEGSAMYVREGQKRRSLDSSCSESLPIAEELTVSSNEVPEINVHLCLQESVKKDTREEDEQSVLIISEARVSVGSSQPISLLDEMSPKKARGEQLGRTSGSCQLADVSTKSHSLSQEKEIVLEGCIDKSFDLSAKDSLQYEEGRGMDASDDCRKQLLNAISSKSAENAVEASSCLLAKESQNDTTSSCGMGIIDDIVSAEHHFSVENIQTSKVGLMDEKQTMKQSDPSSVLPFESAKLNSREALSTSFSGINIMNKEEERKFLNVDAGKPLLTAKDVMNIGKPEQGLESTNQPSGLYFSSASDSGIFVEAMMTPYDPYSWSPMEVEAATGNVDCSFLQHNLKLKSTYTEVEDYVGTKNSSGEPLATSYNRRFMGTVDYIWRTEGLQTVKVLDTLPIHVLQRTRGFPTKKWGSDHLALACQLAFTSKPSSDEDH